MSLDELQQKDIDHINDNLNKLESYLKDGFKTVNDRLDIMNANFINKEVFDLQIRRLEDEIEELKGSNRWLFRTVGGIILTAFIGGLIVII